jgi:L-amino acid N-acyltransferase YncA
MNIRPGTAEDAPRAVEIWRDAVKATHAFIRAEHMPAIIAIVETMVRELPLIIAEDEAGVPQGFMIFVDGEIDALFVDPAVHGQGFGSALLAEALLLDPQASRRRTPCRSTKHADLDASAGPRPIPMDGPIRPSICGIQDLREP